jgi:hypothetical protein
VEPRWNEYRVDYHDSSFNQTLTLQHGIVYHFRIETSALPQLIHAPGVSGGG